MKELGENGLIKISGFHWQPKGERKRSISMTSLTGKVLCSRHNTMLSPLDSKALRFFKSFLIAGEEFQDQQLRLVERVWLFNGHDIERWMLKSLIGTIISGNARDHSGNRILNWQPPKRWLDILIGRIGFPKQWGMYFRALLGETKVRGAGFSLASLSNPTAGVYGGLFNMAGYEFILAMYNPPEIKTGTVVDHHTFRPYELGMVYDGTFKTILLTWDIKGQNQKIVISFNQIIPPKENT
jgi:hypothetical protein